MKSVTKFFDIVYRFFMVTCQIMFVGMVVICFAVVVNRYVLKTPMAWGEPVVLLCMVYMSLVSAALAIRKDTHIRMQVIDFLVPKKVICVLRGFAQMLIFGFGVFMIIYGAQFTELAGRNVITGVGIKSSWLYIACPIAGVAMCLMELERFINCIDRIRRGVTLVEDTLAAQAKGLVEECKMDDEESEKIKEAYGG